MRYEYKVVPAPAKGIKARGVKTPEARFALGVEQILNELGAQGWEYQRADLLPSEERAGLTGSTTNWRNLLVFRRALDVETGPDVTPLPPVAEPQEAPAARQDPPLRAAEPAPEAQAEPEPQAETAAEPEAAPAPSFTARRRPPVLTEETPPDPEEEGLTGIEKAMRQSGSSGPD